MAGKPPHWRPAIKTLNHPMTHSTKLRTLAVHAGQQPDPQHGCLAAPIYQTSTFAYGSFDRGASIFAGETQGYVYSRMANPTVAMLEQKIAALEQAEDAIAFASGTGAISALLLTLLNPGDEVLFVGPLYGGTESQLRDLLPRFGIHAIEVASVAALPPAITPRSRMIYVETPMNPTLGIVDLQQVASIAREARLISVADNTFATPILTQPITLGIDLSLHSATKYIGGHGDATGGIITGTRQHLDQIRRVGMKQIGACMSPQDAYLFIRGAKTIALRVEQSSQNALQLARFLQQRPEIAQVYYPGLPEHPGHAVAARQMRAFGGILSCEMRGGLAAARTLLDALQLITQAVSIGDTDSLACHPASTTHRGIAAEIRQRQGVTEGMIRFSIGIEDADDLQADLARALDLIA